MIEAAQVKGPVNGSFDYIARAVRADEDIPQLAWSIPFRSLIIDRKGEHIGGLVNAAVSVVEGSHPALGDDLHTNMARTDAGSLERSCNCIAQLGRTVV